MRLFSTLRWILKCVFTCNHGQTSPKEGKCYCPDCGRGVIFQWVVLRCQDCKQRIESQTLLRQLIPAQRCCSQCGERSFYYQYLENPSYFQLQKARLMLREEADYLQGHYQWSIYAFGETLGKPMGAHLASTCERALRWLTQPSPFTPALITVQSSISV